MREDQSTKKLFGATKTNFWGSNQQQQEKDPKVEKYRVFSREKFSVRQNEYINFDF